VQCTPRENEEWHQLQERKAAQERAGKKDTVLLQVNEAHELLKASKQGNLLNPNEMKKPRPQDMKYQRLEEDVLLNELFRCFQQYKFWHLRTLKDRLKQPEAHLRDVLSKIAVLVKTGPAANSWTLKPEIAQVNQDVEEGLDVKQEDIAPDMAGGEMDEDDFDDDDDDDIEMEDVQLPL
jgi:transcription initiation factor TFIIF subunit beta